MRLIDDYTIRLAILLASPIEDLCLSIKTYNALKRWGINTVCDLCRIRLFGDINDVRGIAVKSIKEIDHAVDRYLGSNGYEVKHDTAD